MAGTDFLAVEHLMADLGPVTGDTVGRKERFVREMTEAGRDPRIALGSGAGEFAMHGLCSDTFGLYGFCTEDIRSYLPLLDVRGRRCLTVASSGDQAINLLAAGACEVTMFDSVPAAGEVSALKIQALADLEWHDRDAFRGRLWQDVMAPAGFARLLDRSDAPLYGKSWSVLAQAVSAFEPGTAHRIFKRWQVSGRNPYIASDEAFESARIACAAAMDDESVSFVAADARELPLLGLGRFDVIVMSNILQATLARLRPPTRVSRKFGRCMEDGHPDGRVEMLGALMDTMIWPLARMLEPGGVMMASYTYGCDRDDEDIEDIEDRSDAFSPLQSTALRRAAFVPPAGFSVEEHSWETINSEQSGVDVAVLVRRNAATD